MTKALVKRDNEESSGLTGPMALGGTTVTEPSVGASPPADEGNGGSNSVTTPETQTNEPEVPEALVSHSPGTEPSQEARSTGGRSASASRRSSRCRAAGRPSRREQRRYWSRSHPRRFRPKRRS